MRSDELTEEKALAILIANLNRRTKRSGTLEIAQACRYLHNRYGSYEEVAKRVGAGDETIRQYAEIDGLPNEVKKLIQDGLLRGMEVPYQISRIKDFQRMMKTAKAVGNMSSMDAREAIKYVLKHPQKSVEEFKQRIAESKRPVVDIDVIVIPLSDAVLQKLKDELQRKPLSKLLKRNITKRLRPKGLVSCTIGDKVLTLSLEKDDYEKLKTKTPEIASERYINALLARHLAENT